MAIEDFLKQTAVIKQLLVQEDANGGRYDLWTTIQSNVRCLVQPWSGGVTREDDKDTSLATHRVILSGQFNLSAKNQIHVGMAIYNVLKCRDWNSMGHHTTVECVIETA
jgi:head-tail adaptor